MGLLKQTKQYFYLFRNKLVQINFTHKYIYSRISINLFGKIFQGIIVIALIPMATFVLSPHDYGVYALAISVAALVAVMCEVGSAYVLYANYSKLDARECASMQSTLFTLALGLSLLAIMIFYFSWPLFLHYIPLLSELTATEIGLLYFMIPLKAVWFIMYPILVLSQRSEWLVGSLVLQSIINFLVIFSCLYLFDVGRAALFWGHALGHLGCLCLPLIFLGRSMLGPLQFQWCLKVREVAAKAWLASFADNVRLTLENFLIVKMVSSSALGNFNHARIYQGLLMQVTNSFANVMLPIALNSAQYKKSRFTRIRPVWDFVYIGLTCFGIGAVFLGDEVVLFLTHGKFLFAGSWLPWLVIYVLLQNAGKAATAVILANERANLYSNVRIFTLTLTVLALIALVPSYGMEAVLFTLVTEMLIMRILIGIVARKIQPVPFQDQWVLFGFLMIVICWGVELILAPSLMMRYILFFSLCGVMLALLCFFYMRKKQLNLSTLPLDNISNS